MLSSPSPRDQGYCQVPQNQDSPQPPNIVSKLNVKIACSSTSKVRGVELAGRNQALLDFPGDKTGRRTTTREGQGNRQTKTKRERRREGEGEEEKRRGEGQQGLTHTKLQTSQAPHQLRRKHEHENLLQELQSHQSA